ncbi:UNVERIFIED_CONTAM: hypothetical protein FKN15_043428 [Acipenser sinensis]
MVTSSTVSVFLFCFRSLERKLQRPLLAKSRTLPSIPQSPTFSRVHHSNLLSSSQELAPSLRVPRSSSNHRKGCTLPSAGEVWRLEDDDDDDEEHSVVQRGRAEPRPRSQSPFSHFRSRPYLQKSISVDDNLGMVEFGTPNPGNKAERAKGKLKRKFGR